MKAQPESNPTLNAGDAKYTDIGRLRIVYEFKLSIDLGLTGDVVLEAKLRNIMKEILEPFRYQLSDPPR